MKYETIDDYINQYDEELKEKLQNIRNAIMKIDNTLVEKMSWGMPTFWKNGNIIHFAVNKKHIGVYPGPEAIVKFSKELNCYTTFKGTIQFPINKPIPYDLISKIVKFNLDDRT